MKSHINTTLGRTMGLAVAGALTVGLTACDPQPTVDKLAKSVDNLVEPAGRDHDPARAPAPARQGMDQSAAAVPDEMLEERVKAALTADPRLRSVTVDVRSDNGVITLYGTADTPAKGHQAAMVALNVDGVRSVRNEMVIASGS